MSYESKMDFLAFVLIVVVVVPVVVVSLVAGWLWRSVVE